MSIKVRILKENEEKAAAQPAAPQKKVDSRAKAVGTAMDKTAATKVAASRIKTYRQFIDAMLGMVDRLDDNIDPKKIPLLLKQVIAHWLRDEKAGVAQEQPGAVKESMMDMMTDPALVASGVGTMAMIYYMLFGKQPENEDEALNRVRDEINRRVAAASIKRPPDDPTDDIGVLDPQLKLKRYKMRRAAAEQNSLLPEEY
jgi:hypothetical protein